ncbi:leucine-rich repeat protein, partial [Akkermansiaceae bacterium]|nr:leucine-rich repeat protein [Akkermansiaceae bacterium]
DPLVADTDEDGIVDGSEAGFGTDPLVADTDEDGVLDGAETAAGTNPLSFDVTGNGFLVTVRTIGSSGSINGGGAAQLKYAKLVNDGVVVLIGCDPSVTGDLILPDTIDGLPLTKIGPNAFKDSTNLKSVVVPETVTEFGAGAFYGCNQLVSVNVPEVVTAIGERAFFDCRRLSSITIPDGIETIEPYTFYQCLALRGITLPESITTIGGNAFAECRGLREVILPENLTTLGQGALSSCTSLKTITIPVGVTVLPSDTFNNCNSLTEVILHDGITRIGRGVFQNCQSLVDIQLPKNLTGYLYNDVFYNCTSLKSIEIPNGITQIRNDAFYNCTSLELVSIGAGVTQITQLAFGNCSSLTNVYFAGAAPLTYSPFENIGFGPIAWVEEANADSFGGVFGFWNDFFVQSGARIFNGFLVGPATDLTGANLADADLGDLNLSGVISGGITGTPASLPEGFEIIGGFLIGPAVDLSGADLSGLDLSGANLAGADLSNANLSFANLTDSDTTGANFEGADLDNVIDSVSIALTGDGADAPAYLSYSVLNGEVTIRSCSIASGQGALELPATINGLPVVALASEAFKGVAGLTGITLPDGLTTIEASAFEGCSNLAAISVPDGVVSLGAAAFKGCSALAEAVLPSGLTSIPAELFAGCSSLAAINLPTTLTQIEQGAFSQCASLSTVVIPEGVTTVGDQAFFGCEGLTGITLPVGLTSIGDGCFNGCVNLASLALPNTLVSIGSEAFASNTSLQEVVIPASVESIGASAFAQSGAITRIYFEGNGPSIGADAFTGIGNEALIEVSEGSTSFEESYDGFNVNMFSRPILDLEDYYQSQRNEAISVDATPVGGYPMDFTYQWLFNGVVYPTSLGGKRAEKDFAGTNLDNGTWTVVVTNSHGSTSHSFEYRMYVPDPAVPVLDLETYFESQPGDIVSLNATPVGGYPTDFSFQWYLNGEAIAADQGGGDRVLEFGGSAADNGTWKVVVSNEVGSAEHEFEYRVIVDTDGDGLSDYREATFLGTDPALADTDGDGINDDVELSGPTDPTLADSDDDGLTDGQEVNFTQTDPVVADSDGNGVIDGEDDLDLDGLSNAEELNTHQTDPLLADTDGDGLTDLKEVTLFLDPNESTETSDILDRLTTVQDNYNVVVVERDARPTQAAYDALVADRDSRFVDSDEDGITDVKEEELQTDKDEATVFYLQEAYTLAEEQSREAGQGDVVADPGSFGLIETTTYEAMVADRDSRFVDSDGDGLTDLKESEFGSDLNAATIFYLQDAFNFANAQSLVAGQNEVIANPGAFGLITDEQLNAVITERDARFVDTDADGITDVKEAELETSVSEETVFYLQDAYDFSNAQSLIAGQNEVVADPGAFGLITDAQYNAVVADRDSRFVDTDADGITDVKEAELETSVSEETVFYLQDAYDFSNAQSVI